MSNQSQTAWTESDRLAALEEYGILDTPPEKIFDDVVQLACQLIDAPIAAINLIDQKRQWFKSEIGIGVREMPLDDSICKFALLQDEGMIVEDTTDDPRFNCNPLVSGNPGLRFYAGMVLKTSDGFPLGTLCVLDTKPRPAGLTPQQYFALKTLANQVMSQIGIKKIIREQQFALIEKERIETELHAGRERFKKLVDQSAAGVVETDAHTRITLVNQKLCDMLGYAEAELIGMHVNDITDSASRTTKDCLISKLAGGSTGQVIENQYRRKDGSLMWATTGVNALHAKDGKFHGLVANIVDITVRKQAESSLRISEERFRSLVTAVSQMIWTTDPDGQIVEDSPSWSAFTGQSYEEWKGSGWLNAVHPDDREQAITIWQASTASKTIYENQYRLRRADGVYRWTSARAVPLLCDDGTIREWIGTCTDITEAKEAEDAIRFSEKRLHFALQAASMAAWDWNLVTGHSIRSNTSSLMLGLDTGQADDFFALIHPDDREWVRQEVARAKAGDVPYDLEFRLLTPDGKVVWLADKALLRIDSSDQQPHLTGVALNITARKLAEIERQRFVSLAEHSNEFIGMADVDLQPYFINAAGVKMVGLDSAEQALAMQISDFFFPEDRPFIFDEFFPRAMQNGSGEVEIRFRHFKTGAALWMIYSVYVIRDDQGNIIGHATVSRNITDRKHAEQQLRETAQRLQFTLEASLIGDWELDLISGSSYRSLRHDQCFGYSEPVADWGLEQFFEHLHPEDREPIREKFETALRALDDWHFECRVIWPDGSTHWVAIHASPYATNGVATRILGIIYDITERKRHDAALRNAQARLEANLEAGEVSTWVFDLRTNRVFADRNLAQLFAVSDADADGGLIETYLKAIHPDDLEQTTKLIQQAVETGRPYQTDYRVRNRAGEYRFVTARGKVEYDQQGLPVRMPGIILDVTQKKLIEEELQAKEERYGALFNSIDEGFCVVEMIFDASGDAVDYRFLEANAAFSQHSGLPSAIGKSIRELVPDIEQRWIDLYGKVAVTGEPKRLLDYSLPMSRWFDMYASRLGGNESRKVAVLFKDVTERKRIEENLRQLAADLSESDRRKTEFLATLAHELRNPLAPIRTGLDLLGLEHNTPETIAKVREMMGRQIDHMTHLVNDLLDMARINSGKIELRKKNVELKEIIFSAVETSLPAIEARHHALAVEIPDIPIWLNADSNRMAQVVGNLLSNAAKYTPAHGHIRLTACQEENEMVISVTDTGIGIPAESLSAVFDMFTQVGRNMPHAQGGLGIGLSLVRRLVELHGGSVTASSAGHALGSTFIVRLPLIRSANTDHIPAATAQAEPGLCVARPLRILAVDDNADAVEMLAELLALFGHEVKTAGDGLGALEIARTFRPDLIMLDIGMPGMNGYDTAKALRAMPETRCSILAAITGWGAQDDRARTHEAGFDHHLTKPVDMHALKKLLSSISASLAD